jgi:inorganic triphosphatase YgiF
LDEDLGITLLLSPEAARRLTKPKALKPLRKGERRRQHVRSTYFDTPHHVLRKSGIALRVRGSQDDHAPPLTRIDDPELARTIARRRCADRLQSVFTTEVERTTLRLQTDGAEIQLAIEEGVIRTQQNGSSKEEPICEAELELVAGDPAPMLDLALDVCENFDVRLGHRSKAERGYALARPSLRPRPRKAQLATLSADLSVGEAFRTIVSGALEHLFENDAPVMDGQPGGVHQSRVAMRRLRAALRAFKAVLPYDKRKAFNGELRTFQQRLAPARDWHVFLDETIPHIAASSGAQREIDRLLRIARIERRRATQDAIASLESRRYARLILRFQRWLANLEDEIPRKQFEQPLQPFALKVLRKTSRDLLGETRPLSRLPSEDLHELRKRGKKARYATEFFSPLWTNAEVKPYLKQMARLQDKLGSANDAAVARQILWTLRPGRLDPEVVRLVQDWSEDRIHECIETAQPHWRRVRKAKPFWERI